MKKRNLVIGLLITLVVAVTGATFAYWASGIGADTETGAATVTVGTGDEVTSTVNVAAVVNSQGADALVPSGFAGTGEVDSLTLTFDVDWDSTGLDASGLASTLTVTLSSAVNESSDDVSALVNAAFNGVGDGTYTIVSDGAAVSVVVTITLNEPANQAEYNLIAGKDLTLGFTFSVAASTTAA